MRHHYSIAFKSHAKLSNRLCSLDRIHPCILKLELLLTASERLAGDIRQSIIVIRAFAALVGLDFP